jgi:hypothetical protein
MIWPFGKSSEVDMRPLDEAAVSAVGAVESQFFELHEKIQKSERLSSGINSLRNINGLISGYALEFAAVELSRIRPRRKADEKPLAEAVQVEFKNRNREIHVWKHFEAYSYAFRLGVAGGGQEATNKYSNSYYWDKNGRKPSFLAGFLEAIVYTVPTPDDFYVPGLWQITYEDYGMRIEQSLIAATLSEMRS